MPGRAVQAELDILLRAIARELGVPVEYVPLELEIVAKAALTSAYTKGRDAERDAAKVRRHLKLVPRVEARPTIPPPPPEVPAQPAVPRNSDGLYMFVDREAPTRPPPKRLIERGEAPEGDQRGEPDEQDPEP